MVGSEGTLAFLSQVTMKTEYDYPSVSKGGNFANNVIGSVATGSISQMGSISGKKAAEALHSYMGYAALESGAENIPTFQNVEILSLIHIWRWRTVKRVDYPLGEEPILHHSDFSAVPVLGDNIPALSEYTHRFFRKERWQG